MDLLAADNADFAARPRNLANDAVQALLAELLDGFDATAEAVTAVGEALDMVARRIRSAIGEEARA